MLRMASFDLHELLPLRGHSLLLTDVVAADETRARCTARVPGTSPFAADGSVPAFVCTEIAAQAAGAHGSILQQTAGDFRMPRAGYLVVVRDARFLRAAFAADSELDVAVEVDGAAPPLSLYTFSVRDADGVVAEGSLSTFVDRPPQSDRQQNH